MLSSSKLQRYIIPLLIVLNVCITLPLAAILNIWIDEVFSLHTTGQDLSYAVKQAFYFENQPPLYFLLLHIWRKISDSPFFARLFSILCAALTIYIASKLSRRIVFGIHPGWIAGAVSLNPFMIWAAVEIRMYALVILLSSLLFLLFHGGYLSATPKRRARWAYVCCSVAAIYTQYYLAFLLVSHACVLVVLRRWRRLRQYFIDMAIVGICFAPIVPLIGEQIYRVEAYENNPVGSPLEAVRHVYWNVMKYVLPTGDIDWLGHLRKWISRIGLVGIIFLLVRQFRFFATSVYAALSVIMTVLFLFFFAISARLGEELLKIQHTAIMFLPTLLTVFCFIAITKRREILFGIIFTMMLFDVATLYYTYRPMAKYGDWTRVASYIMRSEKSGEPILIFRSELLLEFNFYYKGKNQVVPIPRYPNLQEYDLGSQALRSEAELIDAIFPDFPECKRIWVVTRYNTEPFRGVNFHPEILESFMSKYFVLVGRKEFYKSEVRLFEKREGVSLNWS